MSRSPTEIDPKSDECIVLGSLRFFPATGILTDPDGAEVDLRHQSIAVLQQLARSPGQIVSKQRLIDGVWGDTFVTDDSLVQCIGDIRRVLRDDDRRLLVTVA